MTEEYIPLKDRERMALIRRLGTTAIGLIYVAAIVVNFFGPATWQWPAIVAAMLLPTVIELAQPKIFDANGQSVGYRWLIFYAIVAIIIGITAGLTLGSYLVYQIILWSLGVIACLAAVVCTVMWIDSSDSRRRLIIVLLGMATCTIAAGFVFGPPILRWICLGIAASFLMAILNPGRWATPDLKWRKQEGDFLEEPVVIRVLRNAKEALREWLHHHSFADHASQNWALETDILEGIAILENLHFITREDGKHFHDCLILETMPKKRGSLVEERHHQMMALLREFHYAEVRIRVHQTIAFDPRLDIAGIER